MKSGFWKRSPGEWISLLIVFTVFLMGGVGKLTNAPEQLAVFDKAGYALWFFHLIGILEILGAVGLLLNRLRIPACLGLLGIMMGALITQVKNQDYIHCMNPIFFSLLLIFLRRNWARKPNNFANATTKGPQHAN